MERKTFWNILFQPSSGRRSLTQFSEFVYERIRGRTLQYCYRSLLGSQVEAKKWPEFAVAPTTALRSKALPQS